MTKTAGMSSTAGTSAITGTSATAGTPGTEGLQQQQKNTVFTKIWLFIWVTARSWKFENENENFVSTLHIYLHPI